MKKFKRFVYLPIILATILAAGLFLWGFMPTKASSHTPVNITVVAKNMSFNQNNPPIIIKRGQTVQLTVKNEDQSGIYHDFSISALEIKTELLKPGEVETLSFTADRQGTFTYTCPFHPKMMVGKVIVK